MHLDSATRMQTRPESGSWRVSMPAAQQRYLREAGATSIVKFDANRAKCDK